MSRYWWTVWIKVGVLAVVLLVGYMTVRGYVNKLIKPYTIAASEATQQSEKTEPDEQNSADQKDHPSESKGADMVKKMIGKAEKFLGVNLNYEDLIFDYANDYAKQMMEDSEAARNVIKEPLS